MRRALADGAEIVVKLDADGQMDPRHIPRLIAPIVEGRADYCKGNRFAPAAADARGSPPRALSAMPPARRAGNMAFSLLHKAATGYWRIGDPANGYTAIHARALERIGLDALADCFFFETDMLFRLNLVDAVVADVALPACYPGSGSSLSLRRVAPRFAIMTASRWSAGFGRNISPARGIRARSSSPRAMAMLAAGGGPGRLALDRRPARRATDERGAGLPAALGLALLAAAGLYDARRTAREPLSRRELALLNDGGRGLAARLAGARPPPLWAAVLLIVVCPRRSMCSSAGVTWRPDSQAYAYWSARLIESGFDYPTAARARRSAAFPAILYALFATLLALLRLALRRRLGTPLWSSSTSPPMSRSAR